MHKDEGIQDPEDPETMSASWSTPSHRDTVKSGGALHYSTCKFAKIQGDDPSRI